MTTTSRKLAFGLLALLFACTVFTAKEKVPPQQWNQGRGPVVPHDSFPADCKLCHLSGSWHEIRPDFEFDHGAKTGVALHGAHRQAECLRCHNDRGPVAKYAARGCSGCHEDWHRRQLGTNCGDCHDESTWLPKEVIATHNRTRFPLIGAHAGVACFRCHGGAQVGNFKGADVRCETCHQQDLADTTAPNHQSAGWTSACQRCHLPIAWKGSGFLHTGWPLTGAHVPLDCGRCHVNGVYRGTPRQCSGCHMTDYNNTTNPPHQASNIPTNCEACHSTSSWRGVPHSFPLSGNHNASCATCHTSTTNYKVFTCFGCHEHNQTDTDKDHDEVRGYTYSSTACYNCHRDGRER